MLDNDDMNDILRETITAKEKKMEMRIDKVIKQLDDEIHSNVIELIEGQACEIRELQAVIVRLRDEMRDMVPKSYF